MERADLSFGVEDERVDAAEIDAHHVVARRARVRKERAVRLRTALIAEKHLGPLVADEDRRGGAEGRRERREHRSLRDREEPDPLPGELHDDGRSLLRLHAAHDVP